MIRFLISLFKYGFVKIFGCLFYNKKYISGKWFDGIYALGWSCAYKDIIHRIFFQTNIGIKWPVSPSIRCGTNIEFDVDDLNNFWGVGNYFQTFEAKIVIGKGCYIAPNVGIITSNHDFENLDEHQIGKDVILGEQCWIGMNSTILPGVVLGEHTIVGAGSVVTKSFPEGNCIIAGNPAKKIRILQQE